VLWKGGTDPWKREHFFREAFPYPVNQFVVTETWCNGAFPHFPVAKTEVVVAENLFDVAFPCCSVSLHGSAVTFTLGPVSY
jgi:hypothetical protein